MLHAKGRTQRAIDVRTATVKCALPQPWSVMGSATHPAPGAAGPPASDAPIRPMLATRGDLPARDDAYAYEPKWDGVRAVATLDGPRVRLRTRNLRDVTHRYPELATPPHLHAPGRTVLDGELVAFDSHGRPRFERLQRRMHLDDEAAIRQRAQDTPVTYVAFDLLVDAGTPCMHEPYDARRHRLEHLGLGDGPWRRTPARVGGGRDLLTASERLGYEGVVAKRRTSRYHPGKRTRDWIKVPLRRRQEFVVGGWTPGEGGRRGHLGALLVGVHDGTGRLRYAGKVGTGYTAEDLHRLETLLEPLRQPVSPFADADVPADAHFVEPRLVADVEFREWTAENRLRHPAFKGLRDDKRPGDVVREPEGAA